jgi:ubiquinone/menaquinone biosynthesis C-methylase UbiE
MPEHRPAKLEVYRQDEVARDYDRRWAGSKGAARDLRKRRALVKALGTLQAHAEGAGGRWTERLVDVPCGTGRFSDLLTQEGRDGLVLGFDLAPAMLLEARRKHPTASYAAADLAHLPLADGAVDAAFCIRLFHLVHDRTLRLAFLRELMRVSKHGIVIDYRHGRTFRSWGRRLRHRLNPQVEDAHNPMPAAIRQEVAEAGLRPLDWVTVHHAPLLSDKVLLPCVRTGG